MLVATARAAEPDDRLAGSYALTTMCAVLCAGWLMNRLERAGQADGISAGRQAAIDYFLTVVVPEALGLGAGAGVGADLLYRSPAEELA